jgi:hypothetical protein
MSRLKMRVQRLEQQSASANSRMWLVCCDDAETEEAAIVRHRATPGPDDLVVIFRYGPCPACTNEREATKNPAPCMKNVSDPSSVG